MEPEINLRITLACNPIEQAFFRKRDLVDKWLPWNENRLARKIDHFAFRGFRLRLFRKRLQLDILNFNCSLEIARENRKRMHATVRRQHRHVR